MQATSTWIEGTSTWIQATSTWIQATSMWTQAMSTWVQATSTWVQATLTWIQANTNTSTTTTLTIFGGCVVDASVNAFQMVSPLSDLPSFSALPVLDQCQFLCFAFLISRCRIATQYTSYSLLTCSVPTYPHQRGSYVHMEESTI